MNHARSIYQSDFSSFDWFQNNFTSDNEFCSPDNVDECLKFISQEFSALGYPSIYSKSNDCPFAINCDIVKLLNAIYELLRSCSEHTQSKDDLEDRNHRMTADLNILSKKQSQLKNTLEQQEKKLVCALERERQLKEKNEQLSQLLKAEKDETKRLTAQLKQQKIAFQHEIRKCESNMNHVKSKLNLLLSDKNSSKKIASMNISQVLPRNTGQRGKWKTSTAATSAIEDMYNSVISSYETNFKDVYKEVNEYRQFLQSVLLQALDAISFLKGTVYKTDVSTVYENLLNTINNESQSISCFNEKFTYLFSVLKEIAKEGVDNKNDLPDEITILKAKLSEYEYLLAKNSELEKVTHDASSEKILNSNIDQTVKDEKRKLDEDKLALSQSLENIEREKAEISAQKLAILRLAMQQKTSPSVWHEGLSILPSISVVTCQDGSKKIPNMNELKSYSKNPDHVSLNRSVPLWKSSEPSADKIWYSETDSLLLSENKTSDQAASPSFPTVDVQFPSSDLPSWVLNNSKSPTVIEETQYMPSENSQNESHNLPNESSSEEMNLLRLQEAVTDIERRTTIS